MQEPTPIQILLLPHYPLQAGLPRQMTASAAGFDLAAAIAEPTVLEPGRRLLVPCGFQLAMPPHFEAQVRPRSGLAMKFGVTCLNAPGTIDADYRGEVGVLLINHGEAPYVVEPASRIAQLVFAELPSIVLERVDVLGHSERGTGGFGHTGGN